MIYRLDYKLHFIQPFTSSARSGVDAYYMKIYCWKVQKYTLECWSEEKLPVLCCKPSGSCPEPFFWKAGQSLKPIRGHSIPTYRGWKCTESETAKIQTQMSIHQPGIKLF